MKFEESTVTGQPQGEDQDAAEADWFDNQVREALHDEADILADLPDDVTSLLRVMKPRLVEFMGLLANEDHNSPRHPNHLVLAAMPLKIRREDLNLDRDALAVMVGVTAEEIALFEHGMIPAEDMPTPNFLGKFKEVLDGLAEGDGPDSQGG